MRLINDMQGEGQCVEEIIDKQMFTWLSFPCSRRSGQRHCGGLGMWPLLFCHEVCQTSWLQNDWRGKIESEKLSGCVGDSVSSSVSGSVWEKVKDSVIGHVSDSMVTVWVILSSSLGNSVSDFVIGSVSDSWISSVSDSVWDTVSDNVIGSVRDSMVTMWLWVAVWVTVWVTLCLAVWVTVWIKIIYWY